MLVSSKPLFFTLFIALALLVVFAPTADANANVEAHRRQASRMIKKRADAPGIPIIGVGADPNASSSAPAAASSPASSAAATSSDSAAGKTSATSTPAVCVFIPSITT